MTMGTVSDFPSDSNLSNQNRDQGIEGEGVDGDHGPGEVTGIGPSAPNAVDEHLAQILQNDVGGKFTYKYFSDASIPYVFDNLDAFPSVAGTTEIMVFGEAKGHPFWDYPESDTEEDDNTDYKTIYDVEAAHEGMDLPSGAEDIFPWMSKPNSESAEPSSEGETAVPDEKDMIFKSFKKFDTVESCPDHYFLKSKSYGRGVGSVVNGDIKKKMTMELVKRIHHEWSLLESGLPETIFVRACEDRMDFLRAVIIGPSGTPYQDGLFFFDICFPEEYPSMPPLVYFHSHGLRLNPNLYECGMVCLSLLNTWQGTGCEVWTPDSTLLQVLLSIQALVLNEKPFYNEPGYESYANTPRGVRKSFIYSEAAYLDSCRMMLYVLRNPPLNFEDFILAYFRKAGRAILQILRSYMNDDRISSLSDDIGWKKCLYQFNDDGGGSQLGFKAKTQKLFDNILMELSAKGAKCSEFLAPETGDGPAGTSDPPLSPSGGVNEEDDGDDGGDDGDGTGGEATDCSGLN